MVTILKLFQPDSTELYRLRSIAEAAGILGCTPKAVYAYSDAATRSRAGKAWLETCMVGGRRKTTLDCIQRFLKQEEPDAGSELVSSTDVSGSIDMAAHQQALKDLAIL